MIEISLKEQFKIWAKVALNSFGGPAAQIAVIHQLVVEEKKLISEERFLHALNFCMLLPGPEAQQLATYMGWLINRWRGGFLAGCLFILPGFLSILLLSFLYILYKEVTIVQGLFYGMKPAIIAIIFSALFRISKKSLNNNFYRFIALFAFLSLFFLNLPFPFVIFLSGLLGVFFSGKSNSVEFSSSLQDVMKPNLLLTLKTLLVWLAIWISPIFLTLLIFGEESTFHAMNLFFSKMSLVTFGGAYAALSYVAQVAVDVFGWLQGGEMIDGLAMAETTPGPLIQSVQFVGFMGAYRFPDLASPYLSALIGSILTTWMTFAPCFLWIFTFAPYVEFIRGQKIFTDALKAISASVVGVIFNLAIWFVIQTLFLKTNQIQFMKFNFKFPVFSSLDFYALIICLIALILQLRFKQGLLSLLGICTFIGILVKSV